VHYGVRAIRCSRRAWRRLACGDCAMTAIRFNHIGISAPDVEQSVRFYERVFGMERVPSYAFASPTRYLRLGAAQPHLFARYGGAGLSPFCDRRRRLRRDLRVCSGARRHRQQRRIPRADVRASRRLAATPHPRSRQFDRGRLARCAARVRRRSSRCAARLRSSSGSAIVSSKSTATRWCDPPYRPRRVGVLARCGVRRTRRGNRGMGWPAKGPRREERSARVQVRLDDQVPS